MKGEIDKDFYCSANKIPICDYGHDHNHKGCGNLKHKWPTKEEYLDNDYYEEWNGAMYIICVAENCKIQKCLYYMQWSDMPEFDNYPDCQPFIKRVCACTPWGKPPVDWRPE